MPDYTPHTQEEVQSMLEFLGMDSIEDLFEAVPTALKMTQELDIPTGLPEPDVYAYFEDIAMRNRLVSERLVCFAGAGAYDHEIPPVVKALAGRSEFLTSYTPYQPEVAQGVLQAIFEFQTMVTRLFGLPVANASLYDGASALVEGINLAVAASGRNDVWISSGIHPNWRAVVKTCATGSGHRIVEIGLEDGITCWPDEICGSQSPGVIVVGYPNYLGCLEDLSKARSLADAHRALLVVATDPISLGLLRSPGDWGADVVVGEGQSFGTPLGFGGPYLGMFACTKEHVRRLPGRLVGETLDEDGKKAYVMTLRTREQDIRREKATSNVCTNQTLMAITAAIQLGWLGTSGLGEVALRCARGTRYLRERLLSLDGTESLTGDTPIFREFGLITPLPARLVIQRMADQGYLAGVALSDLVGNKGDGSLDLSNSHHGLLVAVTERRTKDEMDGYVEAFDKAIRS